MKKRKWFWAAGIALVVIIGGLSAWWLTRPRLSDTEQVRLVINTIVEGIEQKNVRQIMSQISGNYHDSTGITASQARMVATRMLRNQEKIKVNILNFQGPNIVQDLAQLQLTVQANATSMGQTQAEVNGDLKLTLRKEDKGWKVINAEGWQGWVVGIE